MGSLVFVIGYTAIAVALAVVVASAIVNKDDDWSGLKRQEMVMTCIEMFFWCAVFPFTVSFVVAFVVARGLS